MTIPNERVLLLGLIQAVMMTASTRMVTEGDRILTVEELHNNAQADLDNIAQECHRILENYDTKERISMSKEWAAWRDARIKDNPELKAPNE